MPSEFVDKILMTRNRPESDESFPPSFPGTWKQFDKRINNLQFVFPVVKVTVDWNWIVFQVWPVVSWNSKMADEAAHDLENDVCFILTSAFLIFTMQTGYALLESGIVSRKNEVNILLKSAVNIICGSCAFWIYGFAFSSRHVAEDNQLTMQRRSNENHDDDDSEVAQFFTKHVFNSDRFFVNVPTIDAKADDISYVDFAFQLAYATTCTAIISGAVAERFKFIAYFLFCLFNGFLFTLPSRWIMYPGWLNAHGVIDIGGSGTVHLVSVQMATVE